MQRGAGRIERRVRTCKDQPAGLDDIADRIFFKLDALLGLGIGLDGGIAGELEPRLLPRRCDVVARIVRHRRIFDIHGGAEHGGNGPHPRLVEKRLHVRVAAPREGARVGVARTRRRRDVRHTILSQRDSGQKIVRSGLDAHLAVRELNTLLRPREGKPHVELHKVKVERFEPLELAMQLRLAGRRNHHGVVDAFAVYSFRRGEEPRPVGGAGGVGLAMRERTVRVIRDAADGSDAVDQPQAAHAVAIVDGVVRIVMRVRLPQARHHGRVTRFNRLRNAGRLRSAVRLDTGHAVVGDEDVDVGQLVRATALPVARRVDEQVLLRPGRLPRQIHGDGRDELRGARDHLELAIVQVEQLGRIARPGGCISGFVVQLDGGAGGLTVRIHRHGVEQVVHHEGHLLAVGRVDGAVLRPRGDGLKRRRREELRLAGDNVHGEDGACAFAEALRVGLDGGDRDRLAVGRKGGTAWEERGGRQRRGLAGGYIDEQRRAGLVLEGDELCVRRPRGHDLRALAGCKGFVSGGVVAGHVVQVDVLDAVLIRHVGERFAVGRPRRPLLEEGVAGQCNGRAADGHQVKLVERDERDLAAARRKRRSEDAFNGF